MKSNLSQLSQMNDSVKNSWDGWKKYRGSIEVIIKTIIERYDIACENLLLLGAGNGNDVPIEFIESKFSRITIVDIDEKALNSFMLKTQDKKKYKKSFIDLSGINNQVKDSKELVENAGVLIPNVDFSSLVEKYDLVINLCFSTQLLTSYFYNQNKRGNRLDPEIAEKLVDLNNRILINIFSNIDKKLNKNGMILHLTDTIELKTNKLTNEISPSVEVVTKIIQNDWRNIHLIFEHMQKLLEDKHCLFGSGIPEEVFNKFEYKTVFSLLWEFIHNSVEDKNYVVICWVFRKK